MVYLIVLFGVIVVDVDGVGVDVVGVGVGGGVDVDGVGVYVGVGIGVGGGGGVDVDGVGVYVGVGIGGVGSDVGACGILCVVCCVAFGVWWCRFCCHVAASRKACHASIHFVAARIGTFVTIAAPVTLANAVTFVENAPPSTRWRRIKF